MVFFTLMLYIGMNYACVYLMRRIYSNRSLTLIAQIGKWDHAKLQKTYTTYRKFTPYRMLKYIRLSSPCPCFQALMIMLLQFEM